MNSKKDLPDQTPLGDGVVDVDPQAPGDQITLRAAIQEANALPGVDEIVLPKGKYRLTIEGKGEDAAATGDLDVTDDLTITGAGFKKTVIDGKKAKDRVLDVHGVALSISEVTIRGGRALDPLERGGGVFVHDGGALTMARCVVTKNRCREDGGGVSVDVGTCSITETFFTKNRALDDGAGLDVTTFDGTVTNCTFIKNKAVDEGGALEPADGTLTLVNCTFYRNRAKTGGGISIDLDTDLTIRNCTFASNKAKTGGWGINHLDASSVVRFENTILAKNGKSNYMGPGAISLGHNIEQGATLNLQGPGDVSNTNPKLKKPAANGAFPPTMALKKGSPAVDAANDATAPATDERGMPRVDIPAVGSSVADVGAYERQN